MGAPLLLVHGTLCEYRHWTGQMEPFGAHYRTIAVSLRYCWPEKWDGEGDDFIAQQRTRDVASFIAALQAEPVRLLGHSRGGLIAFRAAQNYPDLIRSLVRVEPEGMLAADLQIGLGPPPPAIALARSTQRRPNEFGAARSTKVFSPQLRRLPGLAVGRGRQTTDGRCFATAPPPCSAIKEQRAPFGYADVEATRAPTLLIACERSPASFLPHP
jgi:pimeloyl-ACP methyl ester carboxylesterase